MLTREAYTFCDNSSKTTIHKFALSSYGLAVCRSCQV